MSAGLFDQYLILSDEETHRKFKEAKTQAEFNNIFHTSDDRDTAKNASHHSLGAGQTQAAPGSHTHDGRESVVLGFSKNMAPVSAVNTNQVTGLVNTTYAGPTGQNCDLTWKAPPSGIGIFIWAADVDGVWAAQAARSVWFTAFISVGAVPGSGSDANIMDGGGQPSNSDNQAVTWATDKAAAGTFGQGGRRGISLLVGMTPGADYSSRLRCRCNSATSFSFNVNYQYSSFIPLL
jgi:hypothetical protein